jgi:tetratricopeptide (TPR) repeat protein
MRITRFAISLLLLCVFLLARADEPLCLADGMRQIARGEYDAAVLTLYPLAQAQPEDARCQYWLGRAYYGQRFYGLAADRLGEAVNRDARDRDACYWYARALRIGGRVDDAMTVLPVFLQRFPTDSGLVTEYASACMMAGRSADAMAALNTITARDSSPTMRNYVEDWKRVLNGYTRATAVEPKGARKTLHFELRCDASSWMVRELQEEIAAHRAEISTAFGVEMRGFRVIAFLSKAAYEAYARAHRGEDAAPTARAYSLGNTLVLRLPEDWPEKDAAQGALSALLRHEMAHLAINLRTRGQGVPLWLHEALACHYGGTAGFATGRIPEKPLAPRELDAAFQSHTISRQETAYAQAHAMAAVLLHALNQEKRLQLLDALADGLPLATAYQNAAGEPLETFLAEWPKRYAALK